MSWLQEMLMDIELRRDGGNKAYNQIITGHALGENNARQKKYDIVITGVGKEKIKLIRCISSLSDVSLDTAMNIVEGIPIEYKENILEYEANDIKRQLEEAGATVKLIEK